MSEPINGLTTNVTIQNVWMPKDVTPLAPEEARAIVDAKKLIIAGTAIDDTNLSD